MLFQILYRYLTVIHHQIHLLTVLIHPLTVLSHLLTVLIHPLTVLSHLLTVLIQTAEMDDAAEVSL